MILMQIVSIVGKDYVGVPLSFETFKFAFDGRYLRRKKTFPEVFYEYGLPCGSTQLVARTHSGFPRSFPSRAKDDPADRDVRKGFDQAEDRSSAADLDIVGM